MPFGSVTCFCGLLGVRARVFGGRASEAPPLLPADLGQRLDTTTRSSSAMISPKNSTRLPKIAPTSAGVPAVYSATMAVRRSPIDIHP